jgi:hypothetical protein
MNMALSLRDVNVFTNKNKPRRVTQAQFSIELAGGTVVRHNHYPLADNVNSIVIEDEITGGVVVSTDAFVELRNLLDELIELHGLEDGT